MGQPNMTYAAIFNLFTYWEYSGYVTEGSTLSQILATAQEDAKKSPEMHDIVYGNNYLEVLNDAVTRYPELANAKIKSPSWQQKDRYNSETYACTIELENKDIYVAYRGTGDGGWIDNAQGVVQESTLQQRQAAEYFDAMAERYGWTESDNIYVTGHSKGGNKAQYVTLMSEHNNLIDTCYSMDGQGFSDEAIAKFKEKYGEEGYQKILDKMYAINGYDDYVSPLINPVISKEHTTYIKTIEPDGGSLDKFKGKHELEQFFARDNENNFIAELVPETEQGDLGKFATRISEFMMQLPLEERAAAAKCIMQMMEMTKDGWIGIDGTTVSIKEIIVMGSRVLIPLLITAIGSKEGRELIYNLLKQLLQEKAVMVGVKAVVVMVCAGVFAAVLDSLIPVMQLLDSIMILLKKLGKLYQSAVQSLDSFINWIREKKEEYKAWLSSFKQQGNTGQFSIDLDQLRKTLSELSEEQQVLKNAAERVRNLRRQIDFGKITKRSLYFQIVSAARELENEEKAIEKMKTGIERCLNYYERNEQNIKGLYAAV